MAKVKYSEFVDALDAAAALDGTETVVVIQDGAPVETTTQDIADLGGGSSYTVYTALVSQTTTDDPTATVLQNTLSGDVVWTRSNAGDYRATLAGEFLAGKVAVFVTLDGSTSDAYFALGNRVDDNSVQVTCYDIAASGTDNNDFTVEIRVYP